MTSLLWLLLPLAAAGAVLLGAWILRQRQPSGVTMTGPAPLGALDWLDAMRRVLGHPRLECEWHAEPWEVRGVMVRGAVLDSRSYRIGCMAAQDWRALLAHEGAHLAKLRSGLSGEPSWATCQDLLEEVEDRLGG